MSNLSGRELAEKVLNLVEQDGAYANLAISKVYEAYPATEQREKAFCTQLVYGTLRNLLKIDFILGRLLSRPLSTLKIPVKNILRLGVYQLVFLPEIPERAVCHAAVEQVKQSKYKGLANFVNAVLRNYLRQKGQISLPDRNQDLFSYLSVEYSHPLWLVQRWVERFGFKLTEQILIANNQVAPLTVRINQFLTSPDQTKLNLNKEQIAWKPGAFLPEAISLESIPAAIEKLPLFKTGIIFVQDESSMLVPHLLAPKPDELIIDLCAAPGGKSTHLAELMGNRGEIISYDDHQHKVSLIKENAARLGLSIIKPTLGDARLVQLSDGRLADAVLVDAPCSGTGVFRRRIDARYRRNLTDLPQLVATQREIMKQAARLVRPGGRLVYSTCTLETEENQDQITWFLKNHPNYKKVSYQSYLPAAVKTKALSPEEDWLTVIPSPEGPDGFFMCRMERLD